jgi:hypothetical protein
MVLTPGAQPVLPVAGYTAEIADDRTPVGAAEGCDLLIFCNVSPTKTKIKRSQPSAAPTGGGVVFEVL